jgi:phosphoribosylamine---glycine ligase
VEGVEVFCAGVARDAEGRLVTAGGRVLDVTGRGPDVTSARERAYEAVRKLHWPGLHYRSDIAAPHYQRGVTPSENTGGTSS